MQIVFRSIVPKIKLISLSFNIIDRDSMFQYSQELSVVLFIVVYKIKGTFRSMFEYMMNDLRFFEIIQQKRK